jgi:hypothetical protein
MKTSNFRTKSKDYQNTQKDTEKEEKVGYVIK